MSTLCRHDTVETLPPAWDSLASALWQERRFLGHAHATHPCAQRYYTLTQGNACVAGAVVYELSLDLLTYLPVKLPIEAAPRLRICGLPLSASASGLLGSAQNAHRLLAELCAVEGAGQRGPFLALNLDPRLPLPPAMTAGPTLPTITLDVPWHTLGDYEAALRSDYRRRFRKIRARFAECRVETTSCDAFTSEHYAQYLDVLGKSQARLETLPYRFFRELPMDAFELTSIWRGERLLGWLVLFERGGRASFFMGGMPKDEARPPGIYFFITTCALERAIARGANFLDLGQTAEIPKMRLGGRLEARAMAAWHPNRAVRLAIAAAAPLLTYGRAFEPHHVFRTGPAPGE